MRRIHVEHGLSLRFTGRDEEFNEGVEIGILVGLMSSGLRGFTHWISPANVEQARALAEKMSYRLTEGQTAGELTEDELAGWFRENSSPPDDAYLVPEQDQ